MAVVTAEQSSATAETKPSKTQLHMFARPFIWKLLIVFNLELFNIWIMKLQAHISGVNSVKTAMAVNRDALSRQVQFIFGYLFVTVAAHFNSYSTDIDKPGMIETDSADIMHTDLNNLALKSQANHNIALSAL